VELHGNLSQNARTRNLAAFSDGSAVVLVATDIAARGIHVDDVSLVVHADPPVEHKAYLHRSGRTARAGADGTVVTLMLDEQVSDVRQLTRKAGVKPTITRFSGASHPVLHEIAPGQRTFGEPVVLAAPVTAEPQQQRGRRKPNRRNHAGGGGGRGSVKSGGRTHSVASFSASMSRSRSR
jgi:superfamily II DNA/RNA helicase